MKEIRSVEFSRLLNVSIRVFAKLREQGALPKAITTHYPESQRAGGGNSVLSWPINIAKLFASTFDHKAMDKKYGFKKTKQDRKDDGYSNAEKFNNLMRDM